MRSAAPTVGSPLHALGHSTHSFSDSRFAQSSPVARSGSASIGANIGAVTGPLGSTSQFSAPQTVSLPHGIDLVNGTAVTPTPSAIATATNAAASATTPHSRTATQPPRPPVPYEQFVAHMRPQLEADSYPETQIQGRIDEEWHKLSRENRKLWDERYNEQMLEYEAAMDVWRRQHRAQGHQGSQAVATPRHGGSANANAYANAGAGAGSTGFRDAASRV